MPTHPPPTHLPQGRGSLSCLHPHFLVQTLYCVLPASLPGPPTGPPCLQMHPRSSLVRPQWFPCTGHLNSLPPHLVGGPLLCASTNPATLCPLRQSGSPVRVVHGCTPCLCRAYCTVRYMNDMPLESTRKRCSNKEGEDGHHSLLPAFSLTTEANFRKDKDQKSHVRKDSR